MKRDLVLTSSARDLTAYNAITAKRVIDFHKFCNVMMVPYTKAKMCICKDFCSHPDKSARFASAMAAVKRPAVSYTDPDTRSSWAVMSALFIVVCVPLNIYLRKLNK